MNLNRSRAGKGRPAGSIELRVSPSPSKIPYGGVSPLRLQIDRPQRPSTTSRSLSAVHIRPTAPSYSPPQLQLPGIRDPPRGLPVLARFTVELQTRRPGGPRGLLPWGSHGSVRALSGIRLFTS